MKKAMERGMVADVLGSFKSCYLNILAGYLRKDLPIEGAHILAREAIHHVNINVNIKEKFIIGELIDKTIIYNDDELNIHISFSDDSIHIRAFNKKTDKACVDTPIDYEKAEKIIKKAESSSAKKTKHTQSSVS